MATVDRWLLPDGIEEVLPPEAARIEVARRQVLDLFQSWEEQPRQRDAGAPARPPGTDRDGQR